ncbi:MAG: hypothetical protein WCF36_10420 [Candidatus Nanopelagicales bacterium]
MPAMVTVTWLALHERDYCLAGHGNTDFGYLPLLVVPAGILVGGVNLIAALIPGRVTRVLITVTSCGLVVLDYVLLGVLLVGRGGFSSRSAAVMIASLLVSLVPVVMMWLTARPARGAGPRWWESTGVRVIAAGALIVGVALTAVCWAQAVEACTY